MLFKNSKIPYIHSFPFCYLRSTEEKKCTSSILVLISPLISLMDDQQSKMGSHRISTVKMTDMSDTQLYALKETCPFKFLLVSPKGFQSESIRLTLKLLKNNIMGVAVDKAHCIAQVYVV